MKSIGSVGLTTRHATETLGIIALAAAMMISYPRKSGDAAIYLTFSRNFFDLPFSFQPGHVSYGATSPLYVVLQAAIVWLSEPNWLLLAKSLNFALVCVAATLLRGAAQGDDPTGLLIVALAIANLPLMEGTASLFETPLAFAMVAALLFGMRRCRARVVAVASGLLPLCRPELSALTLVGFLWLLRRVRLAQALCWMSVSAFPLIAYQTYMFASTGSILPSSGVARLLLASEDSRSWLEAFSRSFSSILSVRTGVFLAGLAALCLVAITDGWRARRDDLIVAAVLGAPFVVIPPGPYAARYLVPFSAIGTLMLAEGFQRIARSLGGRMAIAGVGVVTALFWLWVATPRRYDYDLLLLRDLSLGLNPYTSAADRVLIYEIQGQFYLNAHCISLDGIVGGEALPFLEGRESLADFVRREKIGFIVTMDSFVYRRALRKTALKDLYLHDVTHSVDSRTTIDGIVLEKLITNPVFARAELHDQLLISDAHISVPVYSHRDRLWGGTYLMWNSVYRVVGVEDR
jgi:hypothetical protein